MALTPEQIRAMAQGAGMGQAPTPQQAGDTLIQAGQSMIAPPQAQATQTPDLSRFFSPEAQAAAEPTMQDVAQAGFQRNPQIQPTTPEPLSYFAQVGETARLQGQQGVPNMPSDLASSEADAIAQMASRGVVATGPNSFGRPSMAPQQLPAGATANIDFSRPSAPLSPSDARAIREVEQGQTTTMNIGDGSVTVPNSLAAQTFQPANAPMGVDATRARIAEIFGTAPSTLNQAITGNPDAVMAPDFQGRMRSFENQGAATQNLAQGQADFDAASQARQARIGGTGSFAGDSAAREARIAARPDFNEPRASQNIPRDVREAAANPRPTPQQQARLAQWEASTQGKQMGGLKGLQSEPTDDRTPEQIENERLQNEATRLRIEEARNKLAQPDLSEIEKIEAQADLAGLPEPLKRQAVAKKLGLDLLDPATQAWIEGSTSTPPTGATGGAGDSTAATQDAGSTPAASTLPTVTDEDSYAAVPSGGKYIFQGKEYTKK